MSWFGTDLVALGCIVGSAAVGGAATLAVRDAGHRAPLPCAVNTAAWAPQVSVSGNGHAHAIVVAPKVHVRELRHCRGDAVVEMDMDAHLQELEAQLENLDRVIEIQLEGQLKDLDRTLEFQLQGLEGQIERKVRQQMEARAQFEEAMRQVEKARVQVVVERAGSGGI